jgi:hypothetical protein
MRIGKISRELGGSAILAQAGARVSLVRNDPEQRAPAGRQATSVQLIKPSEFSTRPMEAQRQVGIFLDS